MHIIILQWHFFTFINGKLAFLQFQLNVQSWLRYQSKAIRSGLVDKVDKWLQQNVQLTLTASEAWFMATFTHKAPLKDTKQTHQ